MSRLALPERPAAPFHGDLVRVTPHASDNPTDFYCATHGWITIEETNQPHLTFTGQHNSDTGCLPTLATTEDAVALMQALTAAGRNWVAVFWDRGWGDSDEVAAITVIEDGDGQNPHAQLGSDVYAALLTDGVIAPNTLQTYKARRLHDFNGEPAGEAG